MGNFLEQINLGKRLVADGATGTNLQKMGLAAGIAPEDLVIDQPDLLLKLASSFVKAGSDIILTCTFGGTSLRMKDSHYQSRSKEVNEKAGLLAHNAAGNNPDLLVGGSMGPTGQILKPYGPLLPEQAFEAFVEQAQGLAAGGVDLFVIETMFSIEEAVLAFDAVRTVSTLPVVVSFSYDRGTRTMMGLKPAQAAKTFKDKGAAAIGANCGTTLENMEKIVKEYAAAAPGFPIWAKPNAGMPHTDDNGAAVYDVTPEQMAEAALANIAAGAVVVGGCCGSSPEHIAAIATAVRRLPAAN